MTRKVYKSAMGKTVDLGALLLQNEQVRAVGNMGVNAAGDLIDSTNQIIDQRNKQVQKQYRRQTNVSATPVATSNLKVKDSNKNQESVLEDVAYKSPLEALDAQIQPSELESEPKSGGLAAAMARSREIKQELEKTRKQQMQEQGIKKI